MNLRNVGTDTKEYYELDNAVEAGSGASDAAQIEYYAVPQYAIKDNLLDITDKTSGYKDFYTLGPWASVQFAGKVYDLPMDSGPMAFHRNKEVFDRAGVDADSIKTWMITMRLPRRFTRLETVITSHPIQMMVDSMTPWFGSLTYHQNLIR